MKSKAEIEKELNELITEFEHFCEIMDRDARESKRKTLSERIDSYLKKVKDVNDTARV